MLIAFILVLIFIIMVLKSQAEILEEDKHYLREDNISLRKELKRALSGEETFHNESRKDKKNKRQKKKKNKSKKATDKRSRVYIFEDAKSDKETEKIASFRNFLKEHSINKVIMLCFENLLSKLSDNDNDSAIEEISILDDNPDNLPIIFYGGDYDEFLNFLYFFYWEDRDDIEWIENPWEMKDVKRALKEIKKRQII